MSAASMSGRMIFRSKPFAEVIGRKPSSASPHTFEQIDEALRQPIAYLAVGPVFGTRTKDTGYGRSASIWCVTRRRAPIRGRHSCRSHW